MTHHLLPTGSLVQIVSYGPFRGLTGTIQQVHPLPALEPEEDDLWCYYAVSLEGSSVKEPIWFEGTEVDTVGNWGRGDSNDQAFSELPQKEPALNH